jgi:hypothetical protein
MRIELRKHVWGAAIGSAVLAALLVKWSRMRRPRVFGVVLRNDIRGKMRTENNFAYLNRSGRAGSAAERALIEAWLSRVPRTEHADFCFRFRCGRDVEFVSALQELTLHELLWHQRCRLRFHPKLIGTTKQPDFAVRQPLGQEFILEACTSTEISSGHKRSPRADRIRDFLQGLDLRGYMLAIDELTEWARDLPQKALAKHIDYEIKAAAAGYADESISILRLTTADGWRIELTAFPTARYGSRRGTVMMEAWGSTWSGPSYPLRDCLKKKASRYGNQFATPYVIAVNSCDVMLTERDFEETLFGAGPEAAMTDRGFWGSITAPNHRRVSAVLFTKNLWPATLLMGQVYACLYLNPWADDPYDGVLTRLPTFRFENGAARLYAGRPLHELLKLRLRDSAI